MLSLLKRSAAQQHLPPAHSCPHGSWTIFTAPWPQQSRHRSLSITCMRCQGSCSKQQHLPLGVRELRPIHISKNNFLINAPKLLLKYNFLSTEVDVYKALGGSAGTGSHCGWAGSPQLLPSPRGFCCRHLPCLHCSYARLWLFFLFSSSCSLRILVISHEKLLFVLLLPTIPAH